MTAYESWLLAWMQAGLRGEMAPPSLLDGGDIDERNGRVYAAIHSLPLPDVLRQADETFRALLDLIAALPDDLLTQPQQATWFTAHWHSVTTFSEAIINLTIDHYHEHLPDLRRWLEKTTP